MKKGPEVNLLSVKLDKITMALFDRGTDISILCDPLSLL
jgi:hypothetical protein